MSHFKVTEVVSREDWERAIVVQNAYMPDRPMVVDRAMRYAEAHPKEHPIRIVVLSDDEGDFAFLQGCKAFWFDRPGLYDCEINPSPGRRAEDALRYAESMARESGSTELISWYRTDRPELGDAMTEAGYTFGMRQPFVMLKLDSFDPARWQTSVECLNQNGYSWTTLEEYAKQNPDTWKREHWRLDMDLLQDVPMPETFIERPYEEWERDFFANPVQLNFFFLALFDGRPVAMSCLYPSYADSTLANTGLTGVRREHRRKGLATGLKTLALTKAKERGIQRVMADNEEKNPMRQLNLTLGFDTMYEAVEARKVL